MRQLITPNSPSPTAWKARISPALEPAFHFTGFRGLWMNTSGWSDKASRYFAFEVKRNPGDLKNHVQRILHHISRKDSEQLYGAFIDLFRTLEGNGKDLKMRLLDNAKSILQPWQREQLLEAIHHGVASAPYLSSDHSILSEGMSNIRPLIEVISCSPTEDHPATTTVLKISHTSSQPSTARQRELEKAILEGSTDYQLHKELTKHYIESGDHDAFMYIFSRIEIQDHRLLDLWWEVHDKLSGE